MQYKCPECEKYFSNKDLLNRHRKRIHPNQVKSPDDALEITAAAPGNIRGDIPNDDTLALANTPDDDTAVLRIKKPDVKDDAPDTAVYYCNDCGTAIEKGQEICPGCGERLVWDDIE